MYIGYLDDFSCKFTRMGCDLPLEPTSASDGVYTWSWKVLLNTGFDMRIDLKGVCYVGSVTLPLSEGSQIPSFEVLSGDKQVAKYHAEYGKLASGELTLPVGVYSSEITVRIRAEYQDVSFSTPKIAVMRDEGVPFVWPVPKKMHTGGKRCRISGVFPLGENEDEIAAAKFLEERLTERFGEDAFSPLGIAVTLRLAECGYDGERYTVESTEEGITITAGCRLSLTYAACKLLMLGEGGEFPLLSIDDKPEKPLRGIHMYLPSRENLTFAKRLFRYVLLPLGFNSIFVEFAGGMRFDRHPEIAEGILDANAKARAGLQPPFPHCEVAGGGVLEKSEVRDLLDTAREYGFEIIPEVQSLGHVQYITYSHPEIAEVEERDKSVDDERAEDARPANFYKHCYCPSDERSYEIIFDIIDEIIEVAKPRRYVHIGHDEIYHLGLCPKCKGTPHDELYARHVTRLYEYLKARGLGTVIWSDMLQPVTLYKTANAANMLPKDILCLDFIWYFHLDLDIEENILEKGFKVGAGNLYSSHYPRYKKRMMTDGMIGGEVSLWCMTSEYGLGKKGKIFDFAYTAGMLWNTSIYDERLREVYAHLIVKNLQPSFRDEIRGLYSPMGYSETEIALPEGDKRIPRDILEYRPDAILAEGASVRVDGSYDRLKIEHTTLQVAPRIPWEPLFVSGDYTVHYEDGEEISIPVEYMGNVQHYRRKYADPLRGQYNRHTGYVGTWFSDPTLEEKYGGEDVLLTSLVWENPHPEKRIASISYKSSEGDYTQVVLTRVSGLSCNSK